ncbi:MAG: ABC transporter substrate-binding protein [Bacteroidales bacterium]|nr:ABC transporter substrate-binding protein [Candidatus Colicola equi]
MCYKKWIYLCLVVLALVACTTKSSYSVRPGNRYATGFEIEQQDSAYQITVYYPWMPDKIMARYIVDRPYLRLASNSCTHVGFLNELNAISRLVGITDQHLVFTKLADTIMDLGNSMSPNLERIALSRPDAMLLSTYSEGDATPQRLSKMNIPIIYINEWNEQSPLARAEWIRVFGVLTGQLDLADSIFNAIADRYNLLVESQQARLDTHPTILSGQDFRGTWYVPAGNTYMGQLFQDAGYDYRYATDEGTASIPLTTEQVLTEFKDVDVWVGVQERTLADLQSRDEKHTWIKAFQTGNVYHFMKRATDKGANDFWETGVVHPEYILSDLIQIQSLSHSPSSPSLSPSSFSSSSSSSSSSFSSSFSSHFTAPLK